MRNDGEETDAGGAVTNEIIVVSKKELNEKDELIVSLKAKAEKMKSDFARYKERTQNEGEAIRKKTSGEMVKQLLIVADTLERAVYSYDSAGGAGGCEVVDRMVEGTRNSMEMTYNQLLDASGVVPIAPSAGERFDDELHTAIETAQDPLLPDKTILSLVRKGYTLNNELIRPAEVIISRGGGELMEAGQDGVADREKRTREAKSGTIMSRFMRRFVKRSLEAELEEIAKREQKLEERARELVRNEEILISSVKELDLQEKEFKKREEEWIKRKEAAESGVLELEQRKEVLEAGTRESKRQLSAITDTLNEQRVNKDKIVVESIALGRYNEELSEDKEKLSNEINEMEGTREALNYELTNMDERRAWNIEEQSKMGRKIAELDEAVSMSENKLRKAKELVNAESEEIHGLVHRKESLAAEIEEAEGELEIAHKNLDELDGMKDKLVVESIALRRYNEALLEERELLPEIEIEGGGTSEVEENMGEEKKKKFSSIISTPFWC